MDRNHAIRANHHKRRVALRKESVDRNMGVGTTRDSLGVALRKESVDRNRLFRTLGFPSRQSLSARRAWIEIPAGCWRDARRGVALRKESVDRNIFDFLNLSNV